MKDIIRIVVEQESGYWDDEDEEFKTKVTITNEFIQYEYKPLFESETNMDQEWLYKTNSPIFQEKFDNIAALMPEVMSMDESLQDTDVGATTFVITYADKSKEKKVCFLGHNDTFEKVSSIIGEMVPSCEYGLCLYHR